jgi:hypothetical protein
MIDERPPLTPHSAIPPSLEPLRNSHEADAIEAELKALTIHLFETMIRPREREVNAYGMPHRAGFTTVERFVKRDGLALPRVNAEPYLRELYRAWRGRNPRRGLSFLRFYLQLLYPNQFIVIQHWHQRNVPYPQALTDTDGGNHYLTSRVSVSITEADPTGAELEMAAASMRAVVPARILLRVQLLRLFDRSGSQALRLACASQGVEYQVFSGTAARP